MTNVDWAAIRARWEAGESPRTIAKRYGNISAEGIRKRSKRESWQRPPTGANPTPTEVNIKVEATKWLEVIGEYKPVGSKDTPERRAEILSSIANGMPLKGAASLVGIGEKTLRVWREKDERFARQIEQAQAGNARQWLEKLNKTDDPAIALKVLERHAITKDEMKPVGVRGRDNGPLTVILNMPIPGQDPTPWLNGEPRTQIEYEPAAPEHEPSD